LLLQNPYYVGVVRYASVEYKGRHEHLIDGATFAKAKAVLIAQNHAREKDRKHHHSRDPFTAAAASSPTWRSI
jgi:hypothetical protein